MKKDLSQDLSKSSTDTEWLVKLCFWALWKVHLYSGMHDEAGYMHRAGLAHAVCAPHSLLQDGRVQARLQQEHMVGCRQEIVT